MGTLFERNRNKIVTDQVRLGPENGVDWNRSTFSPQLLECQVSDCLLLRRGLFSGEVD